ncbi:putative sulfate exporter family transporter [Ruoffia tabacinasalis]|uniref:Putative sulfate exporter family transporter n=1 Tax=Ruoffia tabacinasalis TaxID=87458 RepID=A0A5R9DU54_9LACT|nr:putative sulfate exporter family transporter [Ruoffia tabacinasalis]TLQ40509.1 putative sulfate exporter family transporter [Ruoffia tabacinasalis]
MRKNSTVINALYGIVVALILAVISIMITNVLPNGYVGASVMAMLIGMVLHPLVKKLLPSFTGIDLVAKRLLKVSIVLMGGSLSLTQVVEVGKFSLIVMVFTLATAFIFGNLIGKWFNMDWKLSNLISVGTGVCGGSAIAAVSPIIKAKDEDIAYALSTTFIFDILMVILFPIAGQFFGMTDLGFGLWAGTAINDTSSVVAASYAFSEVAGNYAVIVKLTRTLAIVPIVFIYSIVNQRIEQKTHYVDGNSDATFKLTRVIPWFILFFLIMVILRSVGVISAEFGSTLSSISKFFMVMSLGAIGLRTNFKSVAQSGILPMVHGFIISMLVVIVSFVIQMMLGQV